MGFKLFWDYFSLLIETTLNNAPNSVGEIVIPICLATDNVPRADPFCVPAAFDVKTVKGAPKTNPKPIPAIIEKIISMNFVSTTKPNPINPIIAITTEAINVLTCHCLSTKYSYQSTPTHEARE